MKIRKDLKHASFEYDEEKKSFTIYGEHSSLRDVRNHIELNKVYSFAFMRFVIRMAQRNWYRKITKEKKVEDPVSLAEQPFEDQLNLWKETDEPKLKETEMTELLQEVNEQFQKDAENDDNPF